jgi:hypothetical protein
VNRGGVDTVKKYWWTQPRADGIKETADPELYRYGMHGETFAVLFTVGPGRYNVRVCLAETRPPAEAAGTISIAINGETKEDQLNIAQAAQGACRALDLTYESISPKNGVIEIRFSGNDGKEAVAQAVEITPSE